MIARCNCHYVVAARGRLGDSDGMAEIVNLRLARKSRARSQAATAASENRARHGLTKAERSRREAEAARLARILSGAEREAD